MAGSRLFVLQDGACNNLKAVSLELTSADPAITAGGGGCRSDAPQLRQAVASPRGAAAALGLPPLRYEGLPRVAGWREALWMQPAVQVLLGEL
ncbi:hypothetical protein PLESTF_001977900 [Pleodorina starrii]|nr:hypothetical protein PLESTF_001977900 [Pleodorina starrii]